MDDRPLIPFVAAFITTRRAPGYVIPWVGEVAKTNWDSRGVLDEFELGHRAATALLDEN
jgi:hypothetical protein